ncbi:hypothetical protein DPMN_038231 [Dreissena polymorpha]|uniref:Uncharacterized protein n=1 Tax=Dreissena polymorpha TaxID=45954 RepID=A0A9D4ME74_DREPO|nr:hypothetical protein DPMN_038231 [Dreissena polymorpha]
MRAMDKMISKMACIKSAKQKLLRLGSLLSRHENSCCHVQVTSISTTTSYDANDVINDEIMGKMAMMSRFIRDVEINVFEASSDTTSLTTIGSRTYVIKPELDTAFVSDTSDYDSSDESVLNDGMIFDDVSESEPESAFGDDSEFSSVCELERNVCDDIDVTNMTLRNLRAMFGDRTSAVTIGDTALKNFMNTVLEI